MVNRATFGFTLGGMTVGLAIMLAGVVQSHGQAVNELMMVGGALAFAALVALTAGIIRLDDGHS